LPTLTEESFALALAIHPEESKDLVALQDNGWRLVDPARVAHTPAGYQRFVGGSKAEFGIAKSGYVAARCGWFSDRSACYLASGRPVVAQDTGLPPEIAGGEGLLTFETLAEAAEAVAEVAGNYPRHKKAARAFAEEYLDASSVAGRLLDEVLR
jgi:glycosyltransferase involved in cell wall biosynthesis